ncbi:MAG: molybdopterin-dependent oxidoreductase [Thermomicrobiales bacterium]|nr:molybdopterin-dependent oxidoreductase [Thermomicrobiales bacterium]
MADNIHSTRDRRTTIVLATAAGVAVIGLWAGLYQANLTTYPPFDLADLLIRLSPGDAATWAIETFGHLAQRLLLAFGVLIWIAAWPVVALACGSRRRLACAIAAGGSLLAALALARWAGDADSLGRLLWLIVAFGLTAGLCGVLLYRLLDTLDMLRSEQHLAAREDWLYQPGNSGRRQLLRQAALVAFGLGIGGIAVGRITGAILRPDAPTAAGQALTNVQMPDAAANATPAAEIIPDSGDFPAPEGMPPRYTPNDNFYLVDISTRDPNIAEDGWSLTIGGLVEREVVLGWQDLLSLPAVEQDGTLMCISFTWDSGLISTTRWTGVPLRDVLQRAGIQDGVVDLVCNGAGGYSDSIPLAKALEPTTLLVYGMNGTTLPRSHGFPCRLYVPNLYGEKNVKWLERIELVDHDYEGYWQERGWTDDATIQVISTIETPRGTVQPDADGNVALGGIAFAGSRGIERVEVRIDDGEWLAAAVEPYEPVFVWQRWRYDWAATGGEHRVTVRAVDGAGQVQIEAEADPHPDGMTGYQSVRLVVA